MKWIVEFDRPIWYQPDHPEVAREVQALPVLADTEAQAFMHAIRVTRGDAQIKAVHPYAEAPEPIRLLADATMTPPMYVDPVTGLRTQINPAQSGLLVAPEAHA